MKDKAINPPKVKEIPKKKESKLFISARRVLAPLVRPLIERVPLFRMLALKVLSSPTTLQFRGLEYEVHPKDLGVTFELASTGKYETLSLDTFLDSLEHGDTVIDILDVVQIINYVLGTTNFTESQVCLSDVDSNGEVNILDIVILVQSIVG